MLISLLFFGASDFYFKIKKIKLETADRIENIEIIQEKSLLRISQKLEEEKKKRDNAFIEIFFLDVGRGDAIFINYADRYQLLVDGGMSLSNITIHHCHGMVPILIRIIPGEYLGCWTVLE